MKDNKIKEMLFNNFNKWHKINYNDKDIIQDHVKRYLGYFGINQRYNK